MLGGGRADGPPHDDLHLLDNENSLIARQYERLFNQVCAESEDEGEEEEDSEENKNNRAADVELDRDSMEGHVPVDSEVEDASIDDQDNFCQKEK